MSIAFLFPGQGSQSVVMGKSLAEHYPAARRVFEEADEVLGFSLSAFCFEGPENALNDTINTQPALYVCGIAALRALHSERPDLQPGWLAGHSLGELTALTAAGVMTFADGLRLVRERGRLMKAAGEAQPGAMAALLGLDAEPVRALCAQAAEQTGGVLVMANDNCPGQVVISGDDATLDVALGLAKGAGVRRAVKLAVSIAAHSPLMAAASAEFEQAVNRTPMQPPQARVIGNVQAAPLADVAAIRGELGQQLTEPVRWTESIRALSTAGVTQFIELGAKDVLTNLLKRIDPGLRGTALYDSDGLKAFVESNL